MRFSRLFILCTLLLTLLSAIAYAKGPYRVAANESAIRFSVPVSLTKTGVSWATGEDILRFKGNFQVDRTEFGVGESSKFLGSEVSVLLDLEFRGAK